MISSATDIITTLTTTAPTVESVDFLAQTNGIIFAIIGAVLATFLPGIGSAKGVGMVGEAAAGVTSEDPSKFGKLIVLELLPATQGIYGFLTSFLLISTNLKLAGGFEPISNAKGLLYLAACLPIAIVGFYSAIKQARCSVAGVNLVAKRPNEMAKGMLFAAMVEVYAILALLVSVLANTWIAGLAI